MLIRPSDSAAMTTWEVVELVLAHRRKSQKWLAEQLDCKIAVTSNWKKRGNVPSERRREVANVLGLTLDQLEGYAPLPWDKPAEWPFEDRDLYDRVRSLDPEQRLEVQGAMRKTLVDLERAKSIDAAQREESRRVLADAKPAVGQEPSSKRRSGH